MNSSRKEARDKEGPLVVGQALAGHKLERPSAGSMPQYAAMDAAATEGARLLAKLVEARSPIPQEPVVCVDLIEFEPSWCKGKVEVTDTMDEDVQQQEMYQQSKGFQAPGWHAGH